MISLKKLLVCSSLMIFATAQAAVTVYWEDIGSNQFRATFTGSFSADELALASSTFNQTFGPLSSFDTTPSFRNFAANATHTNYNYSDTVYSFNPSGFTKMNSYSGNTPSGDAFGFNVVAGSLRLTLAENYVPDSLLNGVLIANTSGQSLTAAFDFGDVILLDGSPLITYVNGAIIPEPSAFAALLGIGALVCAVVRRRKC